MRQAERPWARRAVVVALCAFAALACGRSRYPHPPYRGQPTSSLVEVPFPPPPGRVEIVPPRPTAIPPGYDGGVPTGELDPVWVDGGWQWSGDRWRWHRGRWVIAPPGASYSPWTSVRRGDGVLFFAPGVWRDAAGRAIDDPPALAQATFVPGVDAGPLVRPRALRSDGGSESVLTAPLLDAGTESDEPTEPVEPAEP